MTIEDIQEKLRIGQNNPHDLAEMCGFLGSAYSYHTGLLQEIKRKKPRVWTEMRPAHKSDTATDRAWEATEEGLQETDNELMLKRIDKLMSGVKSLLRVAEGEARNQY